MRFLAGIAALVLAGPAAAADMAVKAYMPAPLVFSWSGIYLGGNAGASWAATTQDATAAGVNVPLANLTPTGFLAGGQLGLNYQLGLVVLGLEASGDWADLSGHGPCLVVMTCGAKTKWLADISGRAGFAAGQTLVYGKLGYAFASIDSNANIVGVTTVGNLNATHTGILFGAGVEHAFTPNWTAKIEYNFVDLGHKTGTLVTVPLANAAIGVTTNEKLHLMKLGVNYKF